MNPFRDLPIERKVLVMTLTISASVLLLATSALFAYQIFSFRANFLRDTEAVASIIANNSTAALAFNDRQAAGEILSSLKAKPGVLCAFLRNNEGEPVAHFEGHEGDCRAAEFPRPDEYRFLDGNLLYSRSVIIDGKVTGALYMRSDYHGGLAAVLGFYGLTLGTIFVASVLLALMLAGRFRRLITDPILSLAETARKVGENNDYSVRSKVARHRDELGVLANAFNHMLSRIQSQDAAISLSQQKLEGLINSLDGVVWEWSPQSQSFTYVSRQSETLFGHAPPSWLGDPQFRAKLLHEDDRHNALLSLECAVEKCQPYTLEYRVVTGTGRTLWIRESAVVTITSGKSKAVRGIFQDITAQKEASAELQKLNRQLMDASRLAGMAEVATGVLHNVGNVLNSANVSTTLLKEELSRSETETLAKVTTLLNEQNGSLADFLTQNPKGKLIPQILAQISRRFSRQHDTFAAELDQLGRNIEHIKDIVAMQQSYARVAGVLERVPVRDLVEDALRINAPSLAHANIEVIREFECSPVILVDKHKALQILINLVRNSKLALTEAASAPKELRVAIQTIGEDCIRVVVQDNGVGIPSENLTKIFSHGFTTRKDGHGFGLHIGALNAKELGGSLTAHSDGPGRGAAFTLELPINHSQTAPYDH